jgi:hypothetical protein
LAAGILSTFIFLLPKLSEVKKLAILGEHGTTATQDDPSEVEPYLHRCLVRKGLDRTETEFWSVSGERQGNELIVRMYKVDA